MSITPFFRAFRDDPWEGYSGPSRQYDQALANLLLPEYISPELKIYMMQGPRSQRQSQGSEVVNNEKEFRVGVDVQHFRPEEINIKTKDNCVIIHAKHEEQPDEHGYIMREFKRQYLLPKDVDPATVTSSLNGEGVLTIKAPKLALPDAKERVIPITHESQQQQ